MEGNFVERALLCALFLDKVAILEVISMIRPEMFSNPDYGFVYESFVDVYNRGVQPDMVLVEVEMRKKDPVRSQQIGGIACVSDGMDSVRLEHNAVEYAREIHSSYMLNCLHKLFVTKASECLAFKSNYLRLMEECENDLLRLRGDHAESNSLEPLSLVAERSIAHHLDRMNRKDDPVRILTGIHGIDGLAGGLYRKELMVLGGLSSDGKTALATFMAMNVARRGKHVLHFSFEMTGEQTMARFYAGYAKVEAARLRIGGLRKEDIEKMKNYSDELKKLNYYFSNLASISLEALRAEIMLRSRLGQCDFVVIDYLHTLAPLQEKHETQEGVIRRTITALKSIATEANCAMLVVSQLNRAIWSRKENGFVPQMSDLRDSGAIEYVADSVVIINRPERFTDQLAAGYRKMPPVVKLYVLKNRNGATGVAEVYRNDTFTYFTNPGCELEFED